MGADRNREREMTCSENMTPSDGYTKCGAPVSSEVRSTGAMGCGSLCERHFLAYHKANSLAEIVERKKKADARTHKCARCGKPARWIAGAGMALCVRHQDDY